MNRQQLLTEESGFTLIELLGVALIIVILAVIALPIYAESHEKGLNATSIEELRRVELALEAYKLDRNVYPASLQDLVTQGSMKGPVDFRSPWYGDNPAHYLYYIGSDRKSFVIVDPGANCGTAGYFPCGAPAQNFQPGTGLPMAEYKARDHMPGTRRSSH